MGDKPYPGGADLLHPHASELTDWITELRGLSFDDISSRPVALPALPGYVPQVENSRTLAGHLPGSVYALRLSEVLRKNRIVPAEEVRAHLKLDPAQALVLLLFDADETLEELWRRNARGVMEIAEGRYDAVVAPSYSAWTPRPRPELLVSARRSLVYYRSLIEAGVNAIPRLVWELEHDVRRAADWVAANPTVTLIALDVQTYRTSAWDHQLEGLALLDDLTGRRLTYLVNGPTTAARFNALLTLVEPSRVRITNATTQVDLRPSRKVRSKLPSGLSRARRFEIQVEAQESLLAVEGFPLVPEYADPQGIRRPTSIHETRIPSARAGQTVS